MNRKTLKMVEIIKLKKIQQCFNISAQKLIIDLEFSNYRTLKKNLDKNLEIELVKLPK